MTKFATQVVHAGYEIDHTGAIMPPIYTATTFKQSAPGQPVNKFEYARVNNPTRDYLQTAIAQLEQAKYGFAFSSGSAATAIILNLLEPHSHIIAISDLYGGTRRYFDQVLTSKTGTTVSYIDDCSVENLAKVLQPNTKMLWVESPTNPSLNLVDLKQLASFAKTNKLISVADNTFASPYIQLPLSLGFDIVFHSATKFLNGHSDVIAGVAATSDEQLATQLAFYQNAVGAVLDPVSSAQILRGLKTLVVRMERHCQNALKIAQELEQWPAIEQVYYPGLTRHPQHSLALQQMNAFGAVVSIRLKQQDVQKIAQQLNKLTIFVLAESLGGVESLICQPATMTHAAIAQPEQLKLGITPSLLRLSIGIEDADDLLADLKQAFSA